MTDHRFRAKASAPSLNHSPRPVIALADEYPAGFVDPRHAHRHAQLLYAVAGVMVVVTDHASFVVPPNRALWLPPGTEHEVSCRGPVSLRTLYFEPAACRGLPTACAVLEISDLLRALIVEAMAFPAEYAVDGREGRMVELIIDEIARMPDAPLHAPMPHDERLARVCRMILANPAHDGSLDDLARLAGMGRRTLTRHFREATGMSLAAWRQQVRLLEALSLLAIGRPVTMVAYEVGYDRPSAFSATFHKVFGAAPREYIGRWRGPLSADKPRARRGRGPAATIADPIDAGTRR